MKWFERGLFPGVGDGSGCDVRYSGVRANGLIKLAYFAIPILVMLLVLVLERWHLLEENWNHRLGILRRTCGHWGLLPLVWSR